MSVVPFFGGKVLITGANPRFYEKSRDVLCLVYGALLRTKPVPLVQAAGFVADRQCPSVRLFNISSGNKR